MPEQPQVGRHRSATSYSPLREIRTIARAAGENGARASMVLAASGGLVAAVAVPASAVGSGSTDAPDAGRSASVFAAAPAAPAPAPAVAAPAVVAPALAAPEALPVVEAAVVRAVAKPKPKPKPPPRPQPVVEREADDEATEREDERTQEREQERSSSRSSTRERSSSSSSRSSASSSSSSSAPSAAPAPAREVPSSASGVVGIARTLLGIPYSFGGTSPSTGFDCSGFTQYVFRKAGTSIPRTASAQQRAATPVSNPRPGDLVFYGNPAWHVGIYTGNGMMIDSPRKGKSTSERPMFSGVTGYGRF